VKGYERIAWESQIFQAVSRVKTSKVSRKAKIKEGAEKPIRPLALLNKYSESLTNLKRGRLSLVTGATKPF
jgi:hypothetical protein